ncbi:hypothetical protein Tco_0941555 [Tanacetum coccineum]|uniref:Uncharacterized protein n=1 Tax=Tanacetum coccineum TaxID=301880 RepID=A0ABQ5DR79_9ASTR
MVKEGIVLGHKISKFSIEVDKAKVDIIAKLRYLTSVKGIRSFLGHAGFYRSKQDAKPRLIRWVLLLQEFTIKSKDKNGTKNLTAHHLSRLENPGLEELNEKAIHDSFPDEHLMAIHVRETEDEPWLVYSQDLITTSDTIPLSSYDQIFTLGHLNYGWTKSSINQETREMDEKINQGRILKAGYRVTTPQKLCRNLLKASMVIMELFSDWYRNMMYELKNSMNPDHREVFEDAVKRQEMEIVRQEEISILEEELESYKTSKFDELEKAKAKASS